MTNHLSKMPGSDFWWKTHNLLLIRGLPGSGKSTLAKNLGLGRKQGDDEKICDIEFAHYEADQYFMSMQGVYLFKPELIGAAHQWCQTSTERSMHNATPFIVVSNTFSQQWEIDPYLEMADILEYSVSIVECKNEFHNIHHVPRSSIQEMKERWEDVTTQYERDMSED